VSLTEEPGTSRTRRLGPEEMLGESAELYRLLAEHSTDMISKHTPEGFYTYASPACRSLLGYDPEELVGRDAYEFFHPQRPRGDKADPFDDTRTSRHLHGRLPHPAQRRLLHLVRDDRPDGPEPGHRRGAGDSNRLARHHGAEEG
jgi:PAS domain-containing protein